MNFQLLRIAQIELNEAFEYYNSESPGLGDEFLLEFLAAINRINLFPNVWHPFTLNTRRCQLRKFPYGIIYNVEKNDIIIIAVSHLHRKPDYWMDRIADSEFRTNGDEG